MEEEKTPRKAMECGIGALIPWGYVPALPRTEGGKLEGVGMVTPACELEL